MDVATDTRRCVRWTFQFQKFDPFYEGACKRIFPLIYIQNSPKAISWYEIWSLLFFYNCVTQLKLYTGYKLSSPIFCLWVSVSGIGNTQPNLHFFQYIQAYKPFADPVPVVMLGIRWYSVPPNTKHYQLILTKYQPVSSYSDPVPSSTTYNSSSRKTQYS